MKGDVPSDPRGLIREAYRIEDIGPAECRSIFLDWALGLAGEAGPAAIAELLARYGERHPDHPMTAVLREGLDPTPRPASRRGGARGRRPA